MKVGDVVIFPKEEKAISGRYQYGIVDSLEHGADQMIRAVCIRFRNASEAFDRTTRRSVRSIVVIHMVDELELRKVMFDAAMAADCHFVITS